MTQVAMIFEEEKQQAVKEAVEVERMKAAASDKQIMIKMIASTSKLTRSSALVTLFLLP